MFIRLLHPLIVAVRSAASPSVPVTDRNHHVDLDQHPWTWLIIAIVIYPLKLGKG